MTRTDLSPTALGLAPADVLANDLQRIQIHEMRRLADRIAGAGEAVEIRNEATWPTDYRGQRWDVTVVTVARRVS